MRNQLISLPMPCRFNKIYEAGHRTKFATRIVKQTDAVQWRITCECGQSTPWTSSLQTARLDWIAQNSRVPTPQTCQHLHKDGTACHEPAESLVRCSLHKQT